MKKFGKAALALALVASLSAIPLASAEARDWDHDWHGGGGWHHDRGGWRGRGGYGHGYGVLGAFLAGTAITGALLARPHYYYDDDYDYPPPRRYYRERVYYGPPPGYYPGYYEDEPDVVYIR